MKLFKRLILIITLLVGASTLALFALFLIMWVVSPEKTNHEATLEGKAISLASPDDLYVKVNEVRTQHGVLPLANRLELGQSANDKCSDMSNKNYYGHVDPVSGKQGNTYAFDRIRPVLPGSGMVYASENLNKGAPDTSKAFIDSWLGSASHRAALLDPQYTEAGYAVCNAKDGQMLIVQHLVSIR